MAPLRAVLTSLAVLAVAAGAFVGGRISAPDHRTADRYLEGVQAGEAQGRAEGRASQEAAHLSGSAAARAQRAFRDGYAAGANDVFAGYDGGWGLGEYVITIGRGTGGITYRIVAREQLRPGLDYYRCAAASGICTRRHD